MIPRIRCDTELNVGISPRRSPSFMPTGATDGRVNPAHSRKMIARLQAATSSPRAILLSINAHAGHGIGSALSIRANQQADIQSFLFDQLRMRFPTR
jgi:prolyl oligopeptidase